MGLPRSNDGEERFSAYVEGLTNVIGHADRAKLRVAEIRSTFPPGTPVRNLVPG